MPTTRPGAEPAPQPGGGDHEPHLRTGLTAAEAATRGALIGRTDYRVVVDLCELPRESRFRVVTAIGFEVREPGMPVWLDLIADSVEAVVFNGAALGIAARGPERLLLADTAHHNVVTVHSTHLAGRGAAGLCRTVDPADGEVYAWTQFQPFDARRMLPCFDQPDLRAQFDVEVITPAHWTCVSNSRPAPMQQPQADLLHWRFHPTPPIPVYLLAICAGPFAVRRSEHHGLPLGLWARRSLEPALDRAAAELFALTGHGLDRFAQAFDCPYPGDSYDQVFLPDQPGAMENLGCVTWNDGALHRNAPNLAQRTRRAHVLLHELSHQWFGNLVSPRWWDDLWLSESFADWAAAFALDSYAGLQAPGSGQAGRAALGKAAALRADQLPSTHPVSRRIDDIAAVEANFDAITYQKGAAMLHQLVTLVRVSAFLAGLRSYFAHFAWAAATIDGLLDEIDQAAPDVDVRRWAAEWLQTAGINTISVEATRDPESTCWSGVALRQSADPSFPQLRRHRVDLQVYHLRGDVLVAGRSVITDISGPSSRVPELEHGQTGELLFLDQFNRGYFRPRPDPTSLITLLRYGHTIGEPAARSAMRQTIDDMLVSAELFTGDAVSLLTCCLATETDAGALAATATMVADAALLYAGTPDRLTFAATVAGQCLDLLENARTPEAHRQILWSTLTRTASRPDQLGVLERALVQGTIPADCRWPAVTRLLASGANPDLAERESQRDPDPDSWVARHTALAAQPSPTGKDAALQLLLDADRVPTARIGQLASGIWQPFQDLALRETTKMFLHRLPGALAMIGTARALRLVGSGFPRTGLTEAMIVDTRQLATHLSLPPAVRGVLADQAEISDRLLRVAAITGPPPGR